MSEGEGFSVNIEEPENTELAMRDGTQETALMDAMVDRKDEITVVPAMHEQGASHMADGFYRASGQVAAVCVTIGPGATNTLTGVATAFMDSMPQLVLAGAVHTYMTGRGVLQELDRPHADNFPRMVEPVVKRWFQPSHVEQIPGIMSHAFNTMLGGRRGPAWINLPRTSRPRPPAWNCHPSRTGGRTAARMAIPPTSSGPPNCSCPRSVR